MEKKIYNPFGIMYGDEGKGGVVEKIALHSRAHSVFKVGGAQGSHGVRTVEGLSVNFSQMGCGTLSGVPTVITENFVMEPYRLVMECKELLEIGIDASQLLFVHERALCVTPFHSAASKLRELARRENQKGVVGVGTGDAIRDSEACCDLAIHASDLTSSDLATRLIRIRDAKRAQLADLLIVDDKYLAGDHDDARELVAVFDDMELISRTVSWFRGCTEWFTLVDDSYLRSLLALPGAIVMESSQAVLLDRYHGFHPYTTTLRTLPQYNIEMINRLGYDGEVVNLGLFRGYGLRHGAGPFVAEDSRLASELLEDSHKDTTRYLGAVRVGALDFVALRYAIEVCGGPSFFAGLVVTWLDQISKFGKWSICSKYAGNLLDPYFDSSGNIVVRHGSDFAQLVYQRELGALLYNCRPELEIIPVGGISERQLCTIVVERVMRELHVPVRMIGLGATSDRKILV